MKKRKKEKRRKGEENEKKRRREKEEKKTEREAPLRNHPLDALSLQTACMQVGCGVTLGCAKAYLWALAS